MQISNFLLATWNTPILHGITDELLHIDIVKKLFSNWNPSICTEIGKLIRKSSQCNGWFSRPLVDLVPRINSSEMFTDYVIHRRSGNFNAMKNEMCLTGQKWILIKDICWFVMEFQIFFNWTLIFHYWWFVLKFFKSNRVKCINCESYAWKNS